MPLVSFYTCWKMVFRGYRDRPMAWNGLTCNFNLQLLLCRTLLKQPPDMFCKKRAFLKKNWKIHRKTPVLKSFLIKLQAYIKKRLQHKCFPLNIARFLRIPIFIEYLRWLLLSESCQKPKHFKIGFWGKF